MHLPPSAAAARAGAVAGAPPAVAAGRCGAAPDLAPAEPVEGGGVQTVEVPVPMTQEEVVHVPKVVTQTRVRREDGENG